jgi:hypothetical protein
MCDNFTVACTHQCTTSVANTGDFRCGQKITPCISKARITRNALTNTEHGEEVGSEMTDSKWWGESGKVRAHLSGHARSFSRARGQDIYSPYDTQWGRRLAKTHVTADLQLLSAVVVSSQTLPLVVQEAPIKSTPVVLERTKIRSWAPTWP